MPTPLHYGLITVAVSPKAELATATVHSLSLEQQHLCNCCGYLPKPLARRQDERQLLDRKQRRCVRCQPLPAAHDRLDPPHRSSRG